MTVPNLFVAIPAYDGKMHWETVYGIIAELQVASQLGWKMQIVVQPGNSIITRARNLLISQFLQTDCTHICFVDSDLGWEPGALCKLASFNLDIVGGAYRAKVDDEKYFVRYMDKPELWTNEQGCLEVEGLPGGFLCISREAILKLIAENPELEYEEGAAPDKKAYLLFDFAKEGKIYWGEDMWFCQLARRNGLKVWLYPEIQLCHVGYKAFDGNVGTWLKNRGQ